MALAQEVLQEVQEMVLAQEFLEVVQAMVLAREVLQEVWLEPSHHLQRPRYPLQVMQALQVLSFWDQQLSQRFLEREREIHATTFSV